MSIQRVISYTKNYMYQLFNSLGNPYTLYLTQQLHIFVYIVYNKKQYVIRDYIKSVNNDVCACLEWWVQATVR